MSAWEGREDFSIKIGSSGTEAGWGWTLSSDCCVFMREFSCFSTLGIVVVADPATFHMEFRLERYVVSLLAFKAGVAGISSSES